MLLLFASRMSQNDDYDDDIQLIFVTMSHLYVLFIHKQTTNIENESFGMYVTFYLLSTKIKI
jgi:hypothetical protein